MTEEDRTAAKLKGYHFYIKFIDGEELLMSFDNQCDVTEWLEDADNFLNDSGRSSINLEGFAVRRDMIKYIMEL